MQHGRRTTLVPLAAVLVFVAASAPAAAAPGDRLPDLVIAPLRQITLETTSTGRRLLRFTTIIANRGAGPFEVRGARASAAEPEMAVVHRIFDGSGGYREVPTEAKMFWAGDGHAHWHVRDLEKTILVRVGDGVQVGSIAKRGYCFYDNYRYDLTLPGAPPSPVYRACGVQTDLAVTMGLSVGWGDEYPYYLAYQYVDVTGLRDGDYRLITTADAANWFEESDETNNSASADVRLTGATPTADLSLTMTDAPDPVAAGAELTYTLTVRNAGPSAAAGVTVSDALPAGVEYVAATPSRGTCTAVTSVSCALGSLARGASATVSIRARPTAPGAVANTASVASETADPASANNTATASTTVTEPLGEPQAGFPVATAIVTGTPRSGDHTQLAADDGSYYEVASAGATVAWTALFTGVPNEIRSLRVVYSGANSSSCTQSLSVRHAVSGAWTSVDSRRVGGTEVAISAAVGGTLASFVTGTAGPGDVTVRVRCSAFFGSFVSRGDLLALSFQQ